MSRSRTPAFARLQRLAWLRHLMGIAIAGALAPSIGAAADYIDQRGLAPISGDATAGAAKAAVCAACHGPNGNAIVPTFPRLAGQRADYLYGELRKFQRGTRPASPMTAVAATLSDADMRDLAIYFSRQAITSSAAPAASDTGTRGESLFLGGDPPHGVPPCQGCHGAAANGAAGSAYIAYPALRGQHAAYVEQRLRDYRDGKLTDSSNDFIMRGVARSLDDASIAALAAWLASLPSSGAP